MRQLGDVMFRVLKVEPSLQKFAYFTHWPTWLFSWAQLLQYGYSRFWRRQGIGGITSEWTFQL